MKSYLLALPQWFHSFTLHMLDLSLIPSYLSSLLLPSFGWVLAWKNMLINITSSKLLWKQGFCENIPRYCIYSKAVQHWAKSWQQNRITSCSICFAEWTFRKDDCCLLEMSSYKASPISKPSSLTLVLAFLRAILELRRCRRPGDVFCLHAWLNQKTDDKRGWFSAPKHMA